MMLLLLASAMVATPLEARVVSIDLQRTQAPEAASWYNNINVEFVSAVAQQVRLCPDSASVVTERRYGTEFKKIDRYSAHAIRLSGQRSAKQSCQDLQLAPNRPQQVTYVVRGVPGTYSGVSRHTLEVNAGGSQFFFADPRVFPGVSSKN